MTVIVRRYFRAAVLRTKVMSLNFKWFQFSWNLNSLIQNRLSWKIVFVENGQVIWVEVKVLFWRRSLLLWNLWLSRLISHKLAVNRVWSVLILVKVKPVLKNRTWSGKFLFSSRRFFMIFEIRFFSVSLSASVKEIRNNTQSTLNILSELWKSTGVILLAWWRNVIFYLWICWG